MEITKEEALLIFVSLSDLAKEKNLSGVMINMMNKISDYLTKDKESV